MFLRELEPRNICYGGCHNATAMVWRKIMKKLCSGEKQTCNNIFLAAVYRSTPAWDDAHRQSAGQCKKNLCDLQ